MKVFFRKHGNTAFYIVLPLFFLALTFAFIEFSPRVSRTAPGDTCQKADECCTDSGCGADTSEICDQFQCKPVNFGCADGGEVDFTPDGQCICVNQDGQTTNEACVQCVIGEAFIGGACHRICLPDENPDGNNCVKLEGDGLTQGCSLGGNTDPSSVVLYGFAVANLALLSFRARRKK